MRTDGPAEGQEDAVQLAGFHEDVRLGAASVRGPTHVRHDVPNQDAFACFHADGLVAAAVADGLGSAPKSHLGASYAARTAVRLVTRYLSGAPLGPRPDADTQAGHDDGLGPLKRAIVRSFHAKFGEDPSEYDTTLLFMGLSRRLLVVGQIGDGLIVYGEPADPDTLRVFHRPRKVFLNEPEASLARPDAARRMRAGLWPVGPVGRWTAFLLMTDGIADDLADAGIYARDLVRELHRAGCGHWNAFLTRHLAGWPTPGHYDDKTLVVITGGREAAPDEAGGQRP